MKRTFQELVDIIHRLRRECPWDKEQTHESIRQNLIEEAYEVVEAIDRKDYGELKKELGDLLLHVVFHSVIAEESRTFTLSDVITGISEKLIRRHPHVFGNVKVNNQDEVLHNWEKIKMEEGRESLLDGIPPSLPALVRAFRLQDKSSKVGFDWQNKEDCWKKVMEELSEFQSVSQEEIQSKKLEEEFGDVLFSLVNYARFLDINPEDALRKTNEKFVKRFQKIEEKLAEHGKTVYTSSLEEMDKIWEEIKQGEK